MKIQIRIDKNGWFVILILMKTDDADAREEGANLIQWINQTSSDSWERETWLWMKRIIINHHWIEMIFGIEKYISHHLIEMIFAIQKYIRH